MSVEQSTMKKVSWLLVPYLSLLFFVAYIDRVNVGFASLRMNVDLGFSNTAFGIGAGAFFLGYFLLEVPSNMLLGRIGVRRTLCRIMILWGFLAAGLALVRTPTEFYILRFLVGCAEAGFTPAVMFYFSKWLPKSYRAKTIALFMMMMPASSVVGAPLSTWIMTAMDGHLGYHGWQWMFVIEAIPAVILAFVTLWWLPDSPAHAKWLSDSQKEWLAATLAREDQNCATNHSSIWGVIANRWVLKLVVIQGGVVFGLYGVGFWIAQIIKGLGHSDQMTGVIAAIPYFVACVFMVLWGRHSDRTGERFWHVVIPAWVAAGGFVIAYLNLNSPIVMVVALTFCLAGIFGAIPAYWTLPPMVFSGATLAVGIAAVNSCSNLTGYAAPAAIGVLKDLTGNFASGMLLMGLASFLAGVGSLWLRSALRKRQISEDRALASQMDSNLLVSKS
ncbi:MFS transporter [Cupriavidus sp. UYPR2.512]|uniref:MFS transporter n=1 Tax=Cupriavidus sp. UYPR2.512 TaxID=1080187 RepID=UPI000361D333|nr:MFS transporter [Cupriavidus sp. UYPR2.512]UIF90006.1 MFS transporter [Cupriavidus necator]